MWGHGPPPPPRPHPQRRNLDSAFRLRDLADPRRTGPWPRRRCPRRRVSPHRHRTDVRQRVRGRPGHCRQRAGPGRALCDHQAQQQQSRSRSGHRLDRRLAEPVGPRLRRPVSHSLAAADHRDRLCRHLARDGGDPGVRKGPVHRRLQLRTGTPAPRRRHRIGGTGGQPDRSAPLLRAAHPAIGERRVGRRDGSMVTAGPGAGVRRRHPQSDRRAPRPTDIGGPA